MSDLRRTLPRTQGVSIARNTWVLIATIAASSMVFIDGSVVTLALPQIQRQFHASATAIAWIVELYTLVLGSLMLLGGALGDRYGRRRMFASGTIVFALGSIGCAFAWSIPVMLVARIIQGLGGMLVAPASLAIIGAHFSGEERGKAIAAWSAFGALTSTLGPMVGGLLIDSLGWRSVFWINIPLAAVVLYCSFVHIEESRDEDAPRELDYAGAALGTAGLGALTYALISSSQYRWTDFHVGGSAIAGIALMVWFVLHEKDAKNPLVPAQLFNSRTFGSLNLMTLVVYGSLSGLFYEMPFAMIQVHGYTAIRTALATLPMTFGLVGLARFGTKLSQMCGMREILTLGPSIVACGFVLLALFSRNQSYWTSFFPGVLVIGIGMGITVAPLTTGVMNAADPRNIGVASGINSAVARTAGLIAIAAFTAVLYVTYQTRFHNDLDAIGASPSQRQQAAAQADRLGGARYKDQRLQKISYDAFNKGFEAVALSCAVLCFIGAAVSFMGIDNDALRRA